MNPNAISEIVSSVLNVGENVPALDENGRSINDEHGQQIYIRTSYLLTYLLTEMPKKFIKCTLKIYDSENDPDRDLDVDMLFARISDILMSNTVFPLAEDSVFITNLKKSIYPYFKKYIELFVKELKLFVDEYIQQIYTECKYIMLIHNFRS